MFTKTSILEIEPKRAVSLTGTRVLPRSLDVIPNCNELFVGLQTVQVFSTNVAGNLKINHNLVPW